MEAWRTGTILFEVDPWTGPSAGTCEAVRASKRCPCGTLITVTGVLDRAIVATDGSRYVAELQADLVGSLLRASADHEKEDHRDG